MELVGSKLSRSWWRCRFPSSRVLCYYSTSNVTSSSSSPANEYSSSLYKRISIEGDHRVSMVPILDQWVQEGHEIRQDDLHFLVNRLKNFRRFSHALQVSEWMSEKHSSSLSLKDTTIQLELISRVHGLDRAESFFTSLPSPFRGPFLYNALLNCYACTKSLKKAEDLMQEIKKLGFAKTTMPYNIMLKLYFQLEMYDKVEQIMQEMEDKGLTWDTFTYRILLNAYSNSNKIKEMEKVFMKMEADPMTTMKHGDYITAANGYLNGGVVGKSLVMLKRAERFASGRAKKQVYHCLLTLYARAKAKEEVTRLWDLYKRSWDVYNKGYRCIVSALVILDDLEGAENILDEWFGSLSCSRYVDFSVINPLIRAYGKKGDFKRARELINKTREKTGKECRRSTWDILSTSYQIHNQMENSVKTMKKAIVADGTQWKLDRVSLLRCLDYLRLKGDREQLKEFTSLLEEHGYSAENLLSYHAKDSDRQSDFEDEVDEDDMEMQGFVVKRES